MDKDKPQFFDQENLTPTDYYGLPSDEDRPVIHYAVGDIGIGPLGKAFVFNDLFEEEHTLLLHDLSTVSREKLSAFLSELDVVFLNVDFAGTDIEFLVEAVQKTAREQNCFVITTVALDGSKQNFNSTLFGSYCFIYNKASQPYNISFNQKEILSAQAAFGFIRLTFMELFFLEVNEYLDFRECTRDMAKEVPGIIYNQVITNLPAIREENDLKRALIGTVDYISHLPQLEGALLLIRGGEDINLLDIVTIGDCLEEVIPPDKELYFQAVVNDSYAPDYLEFTIVLTGAMK